MRGLRSLGAEGKTNDFPRNGGFPAPETEAFRESVDTEFSSKYYFPDTENGDMRKMSEANFERMLRDGELRVPPLDVSVVSLDSPAGEDAILEVRWRGHSCRYVVELKRDAKPQTLRLATEQVKRYAAASGRGRPMIVAPYLSEKKLDWLLSEGVSAIDFSGNAAVEAPGQFYFWKTGAPNRYPDSAPIRSAYRGDSSLVPRVLLLLPEFETVSGILEAIKTRGGSLTMGTVSKALKRLEPDLVIERPRGRAVRLIQPERLLDQLLEAYQPPKIESTWLGKVALADGELRSRLEQLGGDIDLVRTGDASAGDYAAYAGEPTAAYYCRISPDDVLAQLRADAKETRSFPNLRLMQTSDQRVYFDRRPGLAASPIQAWLELASGDKRQKEVADQIRALLLKEAEAGA